MDAGGVNRGGVGTERRSGAEGSASFEASSLNPAWEERRPCVELVAPTPLAIDDVHVGGFYGSIQVRTQERNEVLSAVADLVSDERQFLVGPQTGASRILLNLPGDGTIYRLACSPTGNALAVGIGNRPTGDGKRWSELVAIDLERLD
jgi:hypothetical protein